MEYQLIVIGGGPAGLAAAWSAWENGLRSILIVERDKSLGGILNQCIHNGFGLHYFKEELSGPEYAGRFIDMVSATGIEILTDTMVTEITPDKQVHILNTKLGCQVLKAETIILSMGCRERARGAIGIQGTRPAGVYTAGTAQLYMNIYGMSVGKRVVILGAGDIGLIMARRMTLEGSEVLACINVGDRADGLERNVTQCLKDFNIPLLLRHTITEVRGKDRVEQVVVMEVDDKWQPIAGTETVYDCDTVLLSVGLIPENELTRKAGIAIDPRTGGAVVNERMETSIPGIFACGNVLQVHDLVDFVTAESIKAGEGAARFVQGSAESDGQCLLLANGSNVRYTVPMSLQLGRVKNNVEVFFRVTKVFGAAAIVVKQGERQIAQYKRRAMLPSEMERIVLPQKLLENLSAADGPITVSAVEEE